jgi:predicted NBD/HSP70 family sugar kinase
MYESTPAFEQEEHKPVTFGEAIGQRSVTVRRANLSAIVNELHRHGPLTRSELVSRTGLTRGAIRGLIGELVAAGLVAEGPSAPLGLPGRPSPIVRPRDERAVVLALEIAVDSLAAAIVGIGGRVLERVRVDRPRGHLAAQAIVADLDRLARPMLGRLPREHLLIGVGVAVVGVTRGPDGTVRTAPNLGWRDVPLADLIDRELAVAAPVVVANEADLGALAENRRGAARGFDDVIYISGEVGVGGGGIVGGRPLSGADGYAGEVGHMPVNPSGSRCRCGSVGCWETEIGERALLVRAGLPPSGGRRGVDRVLAAAAREDPLALEALTTSGRWLGIGLAGLINVLNPRLVVLGGLFGRIYPFMSNEVERAMRAHALSSALEGLRVVPARLGADAPLLGAAEHAIQPLLDDPAAWIGPNARAVQLASA